MCAVGKTVGVCQYIIALYLRLILLKLADFCLTGAQSRNISFYRRVVYLNNRYIGSSVV